MQLNAFVEVVEERVFLDIFFFQYKVNAFYVQRPSSALNASPLVSPALHKNKFAQYITFKYLGVPLVALIQAASINLHRGVQTALHDQITLLRKVQTRSSFLIH